MPKISIIVPIYNVEKYIERCARSLFEQTLDDIEYIFVNDCTPDNSIHILKNILNEYPHRKSQVKILYHEQNQGQAVTRATGMMAATGDYIIHCDSDDWVEHSIYDRMYSRATSENADIVICDFYHEFDGYQKIEKNIIIEDPHKCIVYTDNHIWWTLWNRLVKRELITQNNIVFIPGINTWEDMCFMMRIYYYASHISYINIPLYHYNRTNENSILHKASIKNIVDAINCLEFLNNFFSDKSILFNKILVSNCIGLRDYFLREGDENYSEWQRHCRYVTKYVMRDKKLSIIYRLCYWFADKKIFIPFKIYRTIGKFNNKINA